MVDSGTDNSFIDMSLARHAGLPIVELPEYRTVQDLNGRIIARATHRTTSLTLLISLASSLWPVSHNPQIDWSASTIIAWSVACHLRCLRSALSPALLDLYSPSGSVGSTMTCWKCFCNNKLSLSSSALTL